MYVNVFKLFIIIFYVHGIKIRRTKNIRLLLYSHYTMGKPQKEKPP
jgi:hypothetical protein